MITKVNKKELIEALSIVSKTVTPKVSMPILECVLIEDVNGKMQLSGTDLSRFCRVKTNIDSVSSSPIAVNAAKLLGVVSVSDTEIELSHKNSELIVKSKNGKFSIRSQNGEDFPIMEQPSTNGSIQFAVDSDKLSGAISSVEKGCDKPNSAREMFAGVWFSVKNGNVVLAGSDAKLFNEYTIQGIVEDELFLQVIIPIDSSKIVSQSISGIGDIVFVSTSEKIASFSFKRNEEIEVTFVTKLIDAKIPEYESKLFSSGGRIEMFTASVKDIQKSLETALHAVKTDTDPSILLSEKDGCLSLSTMNKSGDSRFEAQLSFVSAKAELSKAFGLDYLINMMRSCPEKNDDIKFVENEATRALIVECGQWRSVLMPRLLD